MGKKIENRISIESDFLGDLISRVDQIVLMLIMCNCVTGGLPLNQPSLASCTYSGGGYW